MKFFLNTSLADFPIRQAPRALLLCHGTFSSTQKAFANIIDGSSLNELHKIYGDNIFAWDHFTLSKKPDQNARDLLEKLKLLQHDEELKLDIICHSRGALVVRNLLENIDNQNALSDKRISINKVIFVAGACLGTQLAIPGNLNHIFRQLHILSWFFGASTNFRAILAVIKLFILGVQKLPGIEAMDPSGLEISNLNAYQEKRHIVANEYLYIRANYDCENAVWHYLEGLLDHDIFKDAGNDLVVPFEGAGSSRKYLQPPQSTELLDYGSELKAQTAVHHINFFDQCETRKSIVGFLKKK